MPFVNDSDDDDSADDDAADDAAAIVYVRLFNCTSN